MKEVDEGGAADLVADRRPLRAFFEEGGDVLLGEVEVFDELAVTSGASVSDSRRASVSFDTISADWRAVGPRRKIRGNALGSRSLQVDELLTTNVQVRLKLRIPHDDPGRTRNGLMS